MELIIVNVLLFGFMALVFAVAGYMIHAYMTTVEAVGDLDFDEKAFEEVIQVDPCDSLQLARLGPLVEQVGVIRVASGRHDPSQVSRFLMHSMTTAGGDWFPDGDAYQIWVLDSCGAIHHVIQTRDREAAARVTRALVVGLAAEPHDPDSILV